MDSASTSQSKRKRSQPGNSIRCFDPTQTRVLVVDDDVSTLQTIENMLKGCFAEVTCCTTAQKALDILRSETKCIDIVLVDIYMPGMNGFKFLEVVNEELGIPVVIMSTDDDYSNVLRGVTHGAVDFLVKPVRQEELRNIWQHVVRRISDDNGDQKKNSDKVKKPRMVWTWELHQKFVHAVNILGLEKAVPKRIREIMNVSYLRREHIASHLQKYRLYLKQQMPKSGNAKHTSMPSMNDSMSLSTAKDHLNAIDGGQYLNVASNDMLETTRKSLRVSMVNAQVTAFLTGQSTQAPVVPLDQKEGAAADTEQVLQDIDYARDVEIYKDFV